MVSTLTHVLYGIIVALIFKLNLPLFLIFTNLPDLDGIIDIFTNKLKYHKFMLHNIFAFFLILMIGSIFFNFKLIFIALTLHFVLDTFDSYNVLFFPFSKKKIGFFMITKKYPMWLYIFYDGNIYFSIISLIIFIIFLLFYFILF